VRVNEQATELLDASEGTGKLLNVMGRPSERLEVTLLVVVSPARQILIQSVTMVG
jgi:hypothetical protein